MFFKPIYISQALNTGTCILQGDLFYSAGLHRNHVSATTNTGNNGRGFGENAGEWTGSVEISKEKIPGSKRSSYGCIDLLQALKGESLSSVFSPNGTLISASAAPHCEVVSWTKKKEARRTENNNIKSNTEPTTSNTIRASPGHPCDVKISSPGQDQRKLTATPGHVVS